MRLLLVLSCLSIAAHAEDRCTAAYDGSHPVVSMLEKAIGRGLKQSQWSVCGGRAVVDETKCAKPVDLGFKFDVENNKFVLTLNKMSDANITKLAKSMGAGYETIIRAAVKSGLPFNTFLCARENKTAYLNVVGTGMAKGKGGQIEVSTDDQGVRVSDTLLDDITGAQK